MYPHRSYTQYNVTAGAIWSPPSNLFPITDGREIANNAKPEFPGYENGGSFL